MAIAIALPAAITTVWPWIVAAVATGIAVGATIVELERAMGLSLDTRQRTTGATRVFADLTLKDQIREVMAAPVTASAVAAAGADPAQVEARMQADLDADIAINIPPETYPDFQTIDQLEGWFRFFQALYQRGLIPLDRMVRTTSWRNAQLDRLSGVPIPTPAPVVAPILGLAPGQVGVRITTTGVAGAAPLQAPVNVTVPPISLSPNIQVNVPPLELPELGPILDALRRAAAAAESGAQAQAAAAARPSQPLNIPGLAQGLGSLTGALAGAGVGTLAGSLATTMSAAAGPNAHAAQQARYGCQGGFLGPLLDVAGRLAPQILAGGALVLPNPVRDLIQGMLDRLILSQLDPARLAVPTDYEGAVANASQRLTEAISFGLAAQGISYSLEGMTPLKQMGFNQLAGFLGELAGFRRIADGLMGTVETAAIYRPLQYEANRRFRPQIPAEQQLALMFQKRSLDRKELRDYQERLGLPELYIERIPGFIFNDPNPGLLIRAFQVAEPGAVTFSADDLRIMQIAGIDPAGPDAYFQLKFAKSGLDDTDVQAFVPVVKMGILRREQTLRYGVVQRMFRDGLIDRTRAEQEIIAARQPDDVVPYRLAALALDREYQVLTRTRTLVLQAMARGILSVAEARDDLASLGMDAERVELEVLRTRLGAISVERIEIEAPDELGADLSAEAA